MKRYRKKKRRSDTEKILTGCLTGIFVMLGALIVAIIKMCKNAKKRK